MVAGLRTRARRPAGGAALIRGIPDPGTPCRYRASLRRRNAGRALSASLGNRNTRGSAAVEFIVMAPFILALAALVWDLRQYIAYRTEVTREMFVVAEVIANETGVTSADDPIPVAAQRAMGRLADGGPGRIAVTVVTRGDRRLATAPGPDPNCNNPDEWCLPRVAAAWPPTGGDQGTWGGGGDCAAFATSLPAAGEHFPADLAILPNEVPPDVSPMPPQQSWLSRNLRQQEWWVVVDVCVHPNPGLFGGWVLGGLAFFDTSRSALVFSKRAAWGSVHDYSDCHWCPP